MAAKSPNFLLHIMALIRNLSVGRLIALSCIAGTTLAGIIWMVIWSTTPDFQLLYSNLSLEDAGEIVMRLKDQKVPYKISTDGRTVLVPKEKIYETRLILANEGLPQGSGVGFEIFDSTSLGMTEFVQNVNYQRAIQGELSRTINGFNEIESSRVHIVMPSESLFVEDEESPSASVALKLRKGRRLSENQIQGIVHLISASVSHLEPENVTIVDNQGKMLAGSEEKSSIAHLSSSQLEYQQKVEQNLEKRVDSMLEKILGPGKAIARITCALDFSRLEKTEELYDPDGRVVRSEQVMHTVSNKPEPLAIGIPGVASNMPGDDANTKAADSDTKTKIPEEKRSNVPEYQKQDKTVNYEIGKVTSHTIAPIGGIERISVAVVVDGTHTFISGEDGESAWEYTPRSQDELTKIEDIVKRAVNFDAERGDEIEVRNIPFEANKAIDDNVETVEQGWLSKLQHYSDYLKYAFLVVFLIFAFFFVIRPLVRWLTAGPDRGGEMMKQLPMTVEEIERGYGEGPYSLPFRDKAKNMLLGEDETSLKTAKEWLSEQ